jgi:hypothetical protein
MWARRRVFRTILLATTSRIVSSARRVTSMMMVATPMP